MPLPLLQTWHTTSWRTRRLLFWQPATLYLVSSISRDGFPGSGAVVCLQLLGATGEGWELSDIQLPEAFHMKRLPQIKSYYAS